jgi:hypothetical protein
MAKVLGESGRYVSQEAVKRRREIILFICSMIGVLGVIAGFCFSNAIHLNALPVWVNSSFFMLALLGMLALSKHGVRKLDFLDKQKASMESGAVGEKIAGKILANLPDGFCVINGVAAEYGDLDHVVVGPTGVFVLDSKNWRGVVSSDGNGELFLNGQATDKPYIRRFVGRMLGVREKVMTLAPEVDCFYQALFVFTAARVEAKWGATGNVHCIRDDQLHSYIVEKDFGKRLNPKEVQRIAQAFSSLVRMDKEFTNGASSAPSGAESL